VNAGNKHIDMDHINKTISKEKLNCKALLDESLALIALQGPEAAAALQKLTDTDLSKVPFMGTFRAKINGK
jgi:glycine cleavage system aminomethyltransferase T